jgi:uncharacterized membrane protein
MPTSSGQYEAAADRCDMELTGSHIARLQDTVADVPLSTDLTVDQAPGRTRSGALRLDSIDLLRGLVIVLMVLDHVRDFFHIDAFAFSPTDPTKTTLALFVTRWVTHLCAPTFVFLAGVSIYLQRANGKSPSTLTTFLLTRGLWLILLELTVVVSGFNFGWPLVFLQVIWAIGASMILMAAMTRFPPQAVLALGAVIVCGHGLLAGIDAADFGSMALAWRLLMEPGLVEPVSGFLAYPVLPWFGVMCLGYGLGNLFVQTADGRRRTLIALGVSAIGLFFVLRTFNGFGDPAPWSTQANGIATALSFFNVSKYPPSLLYVLATLGVSLLLCVALERVAGWPARVLLAFGRTPLLTYVLHIYVAHGLALIVGWLGGVPASYFVDFFPRSVANPRQLAEAGWGFTLPGVYIAWLVVLIGLYPISAWFAAVKRRRRDWWLSYL